MEESIALYRRAIRSGRIEMMQEVIVRLSRTSGCGDLVDSLVNFVHLKTENIEEPTPRQRMRAIMYGSKVAPSGVGARIEDWKELHE